METITERSYYAFGPQFNIDVANSKEKNNVDEDRSIVENEKQIISRKSKLTQKQLREYVYREVKQTTILQDKPAIEGINSNDVV